jgi:hypothetical protein
MLAVLSRSLSCSGGRDLSGSKRPSALLLKTRKVPARYSGAAAGDSVLSVQVRCNHSGKCMAQRNVCGRVEASACSGGVEHWGHGLSAAALVFTANMPLAARASTQGLANHHTSPLKIHAEHLEPRMKESHHRCTRNEPAARLHQTCCCPSVLKTSL